jgi:hypothetical protein
LPSDVRDKVLFVTTQPLACTEETPETVKTWQPASGYYKRKTVYAYKVFPACLARQT